MGYNGYVPKPRNPDFVYLPDKRGVPKAHVRIVCETCGKEAFARTDGRKRFCSKSCAVTKQHEDGQSRQASGPEHYAWKGADAGYQALHNRVIRLRGSAGHCEWRTAANCSSVKYEWAHVHDTDPSDPQNYIALCKTCHQSYDEQTGANHARAKLTAEQVSAVRSVYAAGGVSQAAIGALYGISQTAIGRIVNGVTYRS